MKKKSDFVLTVKVVANVFELQIQNICQCFLLATKYNEQSVLLYQSYFLILRPCFKFWAEIEFLIFTRFYEMLFSSDYVRKGSCKSLHTSYNKNYSY